MKREGKGLREEEWRAKMIGRKGGKKNGGKKDEGDFHFVVSPKVSFVSFPPLLFPFSSSSFSFFFPFSPTTQPQTHYCSSMHSSPLYCTTSLVFLPPPSPHTLTISLYVSPSLRFPFLLFYPPLLTSSTNLLILSAFLCSSYLFFPSLFFYSALPPSLSLSPSLWFLL